MTHVPYDWRKEPHMTCPFGIRDLDKDDCYNGDKRTMCPHFVKYNWLDPNDTYVECSYTKVEEYDPGQMEFDFGGNP